MGISLRLKTIANMVTPGNTCADIGTDHGYVPVYLVMNDICPKAFAMDLSEGSLSKARENAARFHIEDRVDIRCSDGLDKLSPGEADTIVISGMGGILITRILDAHPEVLAQTKELILSPHRDIELVKSFVTENGFTIENVTELTDKKKNYCIIKAVH